MNDDVTVEVGGDRRGGWLDFVATASLEEAARVFAFPATTITREEGSIPIGIQSGRPVIVRVGSDRLATGYADVVSASQSASERTLFFDGVSKTHDVVKSAPYSRSVWRKAKLEDIARDICEPHGVEVVVEVDTGDRIRKHKIEQGATGFETLEPLAKQRAVMLTDDGHGRLVITRAEASKKATTALVMGENLLDAETTTSLDGVFGDYVCKGQNPGTDEGWNAQARSLQTASDDVFTAFGRKLKKIIRPDGPATSKDAKRIATWEAAHAAGESLTGTYTVAGWRQGDGALWRPGLLVQVEHPLARLSGELLITDVVYSLTVEGGRTCELRCKPKEGLMLLEPSKGGSRKGIRKASGVWAELDTVKRKTQ